MKNSVLSVVAICISIVAMVVVLKGNSQKRKVAFVETNRMLTAFKEANAVNKEIELEDKKWRTDAKEMEDSLKVFIDSMTANFDKGTKKEKLKWQESLSKKNQKINNFRRSQVKRLQKLTQEKMAPVYDKINALMIEYGEQNGYEIIFGTTKGNILFGRNTPADVTSEVIELLNERYE